VNDKTGRAYVVITDDEEVTDTDIIDITNPSGPTFVADDRYVGLLEATGTALSPEGNATRPSARGTTGSSSPPSPTPRRASSARWGRSSPVRA
jgi:hypothetical protein